MAFPKDDEGKTRSKKKLERLKRRLYEESGLLFILEDGKDWSPEHRFLIKTCTYQFHNKADNY